MAKADVWQRGAEGERRVAEILDELRPRFGYGLIHDVLLDFEGTTSQIDHVLIDQFGALVIETKCYGALLRGTSEDHYWTACYRDGNKRQLLNPLVQNEGHRHWLSKVLIQNQRDLPEQYIQSLIVFASGETKELKLSGVDPLRVVTPRNLGEFVAARYDFRPNEGRLGPEAQRDLWDFLIAADKSSDPEEVARHTALVQRAKNGGARKRTRNPGQKSAAEVKWEAKQARKLKKQEEEKAKFVVFVALILGMLALSMLSSCAR